MSEKFLHTISDVSELAESVYSFVFDVLMNQKSNKGMQFTIAKIINYIDAKYDKELLVKELSNVFGLMPN
ncbi:MAG: hypothetical protein PUB42_04825 [Firmicutes bacterium]|nr:hypothetical protein [Bacillota bacterium]